MDKNIGHEYDKDIESRFRDEVKAVDFPWPILNTITDGGLNEDSLMIIFAPPGIGKSTVCCIEAAHVLKQSKNVLYYTLELSEAYVGKKVDSILTGIEMKQLKHNRTLVEKTISGLPGRLIIKEYPPKKASLDTIESHIKQLEILYDFVPDLIIIDYPDLLKARRARKDNTEESDDVYIELKGIAKERKIPIIAPSQINRTGSRDSILEGDKVAGSYGKMMIGDFCMAVARPRKMKLQMKGVVSIMKSRLGPDGMAFPADIDISKGHLFIHDHEYEEGMDDQGSNQDGISNETIDRMRNKLKHMGEQEK